MSECSLGLGALLGPPEPIPGCPDLDSGDGNALQVTVTPTPVQVWAPEL